MNKSNTIIGIDIGTTKIVVLAGKVNSKGQLQILGVGKAVSDGVRRGVVTNIDKTVDSIQKALATATKKLKEPVRDAYVGIAGEHIKSLQHRGLLIRSDLETEISKKDIFKLKEDMHKLALPAGYKIIHVLPQEFIIDGEQGITEPVGMAGIRLEANFHIITGLMGAAKNINRSVKRAGINVADLILEPLASARAVLSEEEIESGVALVDIGGGTTDIAIFQNGIIRHTSVIPFGGDIITEDIRTGFKILLNQAEQLKTQYGCALPQDTQLKEIVSIPRKHDREPKQVKVYHLAKIIEARMEEILKMIHYEIKASGFEDKLISGIVLTGGGAQLKNIIELAEFVTGIDARLGYPTEHLSTTHSKDLNNPSFSTAIGLLLLGNDEENEKRDKELLLAPNIETQVGNSSSTETNVAPQPKENKDVKSENTNEETEKQTEKKKPGFLGSLFKKATKWFEDDNDYTDFEND